MQETQVFIKYYFSPKPTIIYGQQFESNTIQNLIINKFKHFIKQNLGNIILA
jgi:hypothetical protein